MESLNTSTEDTSSTVVYSEVVTLSSDNTPPKKYVYIIKQINEQEIDPLKKESIVAVYTNRHVAEIDFLKEKNKNPSVELVVSEM